MSPPEVLVGRKCEYKAYHQTVNNGIPKREPVEDPFSQVGDDDDSFALVIEFSFKEKEPKKTTLTVNSPHILKAFRKKIVSYKSITSDFKSPVVLRDPAPMLVHYWEQLDEYRRDLDGDARKHMDLLFNFMERELKPDRDEALDMIATKHINFKNAWFIFKPGELLYREFKGEPWLLVCKKMAYEVSNDDGPYIEIQAEYTDSDGTMTGNAVYEEKLFQRKDFPQDTPVPITGLNIFPRQYHPATDAELESKCRIRGEKFISLKDRCTVRYTGAAEWLKKPLSDYYDPSGCKYRGVWLPYTETGRVILDRRTFSEEQQMARAKVTRAENPNPYLCPPYTMGYSLGLKQWARFLVDNIDEAQWKHNAWDSLVLPDREKSFLRSLVSSHEYSNDPRDHSKQKGKGLVVLLHGTPGSGKTLTAEVAAEASQKALVSTSVGELSRTSSAFSGSQEFEFELKRILQYATIWQAIVLFDEADVFLEARTDNNTNRNSLVATFLKELEYFSGVVFLTTNRVSSFDIAMKSRIHLALGYQPPTADVRREIWKQYLGGVPSSDSTSKSNGDRVTGTICAADDELRSETVIKSLAEKASLNGREIANAVNTALTMARFQRSPLKLEHIDMVLEVRKTFEENLATAAKATSHSAGMGILEIGSDGKKA